MLFINKHRKVVLHVPTLALLLVGPWALFELSSKASVNVRIGFGAAIACALLLGTRVIKRVGVATQAG